MQVDTWGAVILRRWEAEPIHHLLRSWHDGGHRVQRVELEGGAVRAEQKLVTACGQVWESWSWIEHDGVQQPGTLHRVKHGLVLRRRDHAEKLGPLCRRCAEAVEGGDVT